MGVVSCRGQGPFGRRRPRRVPGLAQAARVLAALVLPALALVGCEQDKSAPTAPSAQISPEQLTADLAGRVLARVGARPITLADYTAALERMDQFERQRYQAPQRRRQLLEELITLELLAREAERRGLDKQPQAQELQRQLLRDELLRKRREDLPKLEDLPMDRLREYYVAHRDELREPERRRVAHILMADREKASEILARALTATPAQWGELVTAHSLDDSAAISPVKPEATPLELAGDLGLISAPGSDRGENLGVPEAVREAVFKLQTVGQVYDTLVEYQDRFHIVRLMGISPERDRSFAEAERSIRVRVLQEIAEERERELVQELRKSVPVSINEAALARIKAPEPKP